MPSMKFRRTCSGCNATFFAEDRRASLCVKCVRKRAAAPPPPPRPQHHQSARPDSAHTPTAPPKRRTPPSAARTGKPATPRRAPRPAKTAELTEELRHKIEELYNNLKENTESLKQLHSQISNQLWIKPQLVAEVVTRLRKPQVGIEQCTLSEEKRQKVIDLYIKLIREGIRPPEGRRVKIASELNLPQREVVLAVREWSNKIMGALSRQQLFEIEKEYFRLINANGCHIFAELPQIISNNLGFASVEQVARWLDQLHDETKLDERARPLPDDQVNQIIDQYKHYLQQEHPPENSLHGTLAKLVGVKPTQVHRVLCQYRCTLRPK